MYRERQGSCHNPVVSAMMTKTEFLECKRFLHLADKYALNSSDTFAQVRPLLKTINEQFILNYQPTHHVSIDKSMTPYFGKLGAKQYIHGKTIKFGFKLWVIATSLGYSIQFHLYPSRRTTLFQHL